MTKLLAHSPLGGSGAERWMKCPASVKLSVGITDTDEDNEFSGPGTVAHALAAACLESDFASWEMIGEWAYKGEIAPPGSSPEDMDDPSQVIFIDKEMADAAQVYLDAIYQAHPALDQGNHWIERRFHCPEVHELFYGKPDFSYMDFPARMLHVWDYKHGAGIVVEVKENPQLMYYGIGALLDLGLVGKVDTVILHIAQPRGFHFDGPLRSWAISTDGLMMWCDDVLAPAMDHALVSSDTMSGEHCRFCPVRGRRCPQIMADLSELERLVRKMNTQPAPKLTANELGSILDLMVPAMIARKQALKNATGMLNAGHSVPGWKLAKARSNRIFKEEADAQAQDKFGNAAYTLPELKSPAQIDKLPEGEAFTKRWAFKPDTGLTVVPEGDSRMAISKDTKSLFKATKKGTK